jgi:hypothetical protein
MWSCTSIFLYALMACIGRTLHDVFLYLSALPCCGFVFCLLPLGWFLTFLTACWQEMNIWICVQPSCISVGSGVLRYLVVNAMTYCNHVASCGPPSCFLNTFSLLTCLCSSATGFFSVHHLLSSPFTFWKMFSLFFLASLLSICFALSPPDPSVFHWLAHKAVTLSPAIISCLYFLHAAYSSTLKMEVVCSFKTVNFYQAMWCHTLEHGNLYILLFHHTLLWEHVLWKLKWLFETDALI